MEFWSQLSEDTPGNLRKFQKMLNNCIYIIKEITNFYILSKDLMRLTELGNKINIVDSTLEDHWNKLVQMGTEMPEMMRFYARFLHNILNDKDGSEKIMER